jgi:hypothetical protein
MLVLDNRLRLPTDYILLLVDSNQPTIGFNRFIITSSVFISNQAFSQLVHVLHVFHIIVEFYLFTIDVLFTSFHILVFFFEIIVTSNKDSDSMRDLIEHILFFSYNNEANFKEKTKFPMVSHHSNDYFQFV